MKIKVIATHYIDTTDWQRAEEQVEQKLSDADQITSEPASKHPKDLVAFGIAKRILADHNRIFFMEDTNQYNTNVAELKALTLEWLSEIVDEVISNNEINWS